jgi:phosphoserine aminotransferase
MGLFFFHLVKVKNIIKKKYISGKRSNFARSLKQVKKVQLFITIKQMKKHNFSAGPSVLSQYTIQNTVDAILNFADTGLSLMEVSHRGKEFIAVSDEARKLVKELLNVPETHDVIFLGGGASLQFCMVPYNLLNKKASYLDTGTWASKAIKEAKFFGEVEVVASSKDKNYCYIPKDYTVSDDSEYFHITTNNTIFGTQLQAIPEVSIPLVADMSSDIFSRPVDVSKFDLIYAGAQKNLAPAGVTIIIVRKDALGKVERPIPSMLNYRIHIDNDSMYNTPPVVPVFAALQTLKWYKELRGIAAMQNMNIEKAGILYEEIDRNPMFTGTAFADDRSLMNICFVMSDNYKELENDFASFASKAGMVGIKGHRSVGGFRASTYNALPIESVKALVETMREFERQF